MNSNSFQWFFKSVDNFPLPKVHGQGRNENKNLQEQVQIRKLNRKLDILKAENEHYANLTGKIPDYNEQLLTLKTINFELNREVANLKSQLENQSNEIGIEIGQVRHQLLQTMSPVRTGHVMGTHYSPSWST